MKKIMVFTLLTALGQQSLEAKGKGDSTRTTQGAITPEQQQLTAAYNQGKADAKTPVAPQNPDLVTFLTTQVQIKDPSDPTGNTTKTTEQSSLFPNLTGLAPIPAAYFQGYLDGIPNLKSIEQQGTNDGKSCGMRDANSSVNDMLANQKTLHDSLTAHMQLMSLMTRKTNSGTSATGTYTTTYTDPTAKATQTNAILKQLGVNQKYLWPVSDPNQPNQTPNVSQYIQSFIYLAAFAQAYICYAIPPLLKGMSTAVSNYRKSLATSTPLTTANR